MSKQKYYSLSEILKHDCQYYALVGERSNGKSYAVKSYILDKFFDDGKEFMYLRRYSDDIKPNYVTQYFADMIDYLKKKTNNKYNSFRYKAGNIFVEHIDDEGNQTDVKQIGYARSLNQAERMKSTAYPNVDTIIFEEFLATGMYLANETDLFESIVSTVARRRKIKVFLVGNKISRNSVYFNHFQLTNVPKQKEGTIDIYEQMTNPIQYDIDTGKPISVKIAVEMCRNETANTHMFFGQSQKAITSGHWISEVQPHITLKDFHTVIYTMVVKYRMSTFKCDVIMDTKTNDIFWYVAPKTTPIKKNTRVISDEIDTSIMYSNTFSPLNNKEGLLFNLIKENKIFYSDNLTGTEFKEAIAYFYTNKLGR